MGVQQPVSHLGVPFQAATDGRRNRLPRLATQSRQRLDVNGDAAHAAHGARAWRDFHTQPELLEDALLQAPQLLQAFHILQAFEQAFLFLASQAQDAQVGVG